jgi:predicted flap endonuclease-1-like 5' DNA nuclease/cell division protein FtsB
MSEIIMKMLLCLLIAAVLGAVIGWLLRSLFCKKKCDEFELNLRDRDKEIADLRLSLSKAKTAAATENTKDDAEIAALKAKIATLESNLSAKGDLDTEWSNKYALLQTDLSDWKSKHAKLETDFSAQADTIGNADSELKARNADLEADLKATKAALSVCHESQASIESELKELKSSAAVPAVGFVSPTVVSNDDEIAKLKTQIAQLQVQYEESESEKVYLLGRVKKAESGESISQVVPMDQRDDLELVHGIGPVLERMLYDLGIYFFKDIASWDAAKIAEIDAKLPRFQGRIEREGWVESAKEEHFKKYNERL